MIFTELGRTGLKISQIGIGSWQIGSKYWGWGREYSEQETIDAIRRAIELGINFIDTAEMYGDGESERIIGKAIKNMRDNVVIATKVWPTHLTYDGVLKACERSIQRLGVDIIDLYQIHWPNPLIPLSQTMRAMEKLVKEGKIRYIGVSNFSLKKLIQAQEALRNNEIVSNQVKYNMIERDAEKELLPFAEKNKITIIAYSPLAQGLLTGKYGPENRPQDNIRKINILFDKENLKRLQPLISILREIASRRGKTPAQVALNWLIRKKEVVAIPGVKRQSQAEENAGAADFSLSEDELRMIESVLNNIKIENIISALKVPLRLLIG
ncbi:MAG: aldo/keto reductase [Nitrososphaerota archaeon]